MLKSLTHAVLLLLQLALVIAICFEFETRFEHVVTGFLIVLYATGSLFVTEAGVLRAVNQSTLYELLVPLHRAIGNVATANELEATVKQTQDSIDENGKSVLLVIRTHQAMFYIGALNILYGVIFASNGVTQ